MGSVERTLSNDSERGINEVGESTERVRVPRVRNPMLDAEIKGLHVD